MNSAILDINAIIFDLDGVLCSTDKYHYLAWKELASQLNIYFDKKMNNRLRGISRRNSLDLILAQSGKRYSEKEIEGFAEEKNKIYKKFLGQMTKNDVDRKVRDVLKELRNQGYKLAVGSSSKNAKIILSQIELESAFDVIICGTDVTQSKPAPDIFLCAAQKLEEKPKNCLVVEDARAGIVAAKAAGMTALALFGDARECGLEDYNLKSFDDLYNVLENV